MSWVSTLVRALAKDKRLALDLLLQLLLKGKIAKAELRTVMQRANIGVLLSDPAAEQIMQGLEMAYRWTSPEWLTQQARKTVEELIADVEPAHKLIWQILEIVKKENDDV